MKRCEWPCLPRACVATSHRQFAPLTGTQGIGAAHIIDGRQPHSLLQELLTDSGVGTMITG